jgi:hypothetical protein
MKFPRHWAKATRSAQDAGGEQLDLVAWGWSDTDLLAAQAAAQSRLARMAESVARGGFKALGRYGYGERPLREPVLETFAGAAVTRNSYGCEVLNTERAMFIDIDAADASKPGIIGRLIGRQAADPQADALAKVQAWLARNPDWGFRAYRTKNGLRLMATHAPVDPPHGEGVMSALGADPLYMRLCRLQQSYRARLTPKPWRCGTGAPRVEWPFADLRAESAFREWNEDYRRKHSRYATCRFLRRLGSEKVHPEVAPLMSLHDERTRCGAELPLA